MCGQNKWMSPQNKKEASYFCFILFQISIFIFSYLTSIFFYQVEGQLDNLYMVKTIMISDSYIQLRKSNDTVKNKLLPSKSFLCGFKCNQLLSISMTPPWGGRQSGQHIFFWKVAVRLLLTKSQIDYEKLHDCTDHNIQLFKIHLKMKSQACSILC